MFSSLPVIIIIIIIVIFYPGSQFPGNEKITLCNTKKVQKKSSWNEPYSSSFTLLLLLLFFFAPSVV